MITCLPLMRISYFLASRSSSIFKTLSLSISIMRSSFFCSSIHSYSSYLFSLICLSLMVTTFEYKTIWFICLTSSRSSSSYFWAFESRVSALTFSLTCHSSGLTFEALCWSISIILVFLAFDFAIAAYFCSSWSLFSWRAWSFDLITVESLILARSEAEIITASCWLLDSVFFLIVRSSSRLMTLAPVF